MELTITKFTPVYRTPGDTGMFIQWSVKKPPTSALTFKLERSTGPDGPYELVQENIHTFYYYDNHREIPFPETTENRENLNFYSLMRTIYYRVTATAVTGETATDTTEDIDTFDNRLRNLHRKMQRDLRIGLKFNGTDTYLLKRKQWGTRCKQCFDLLTKSVTNSKCPICYGTGFESGYATPVLLRIRFLAPNSDVQMTPQGWTDTSKVRVITLAYPRIDPGDILVVPHNNSRFLVEQQSQTELRRTPVHQALAVSELSRDSVEYRIVVKTDVIPAIF